MDEIKRVCCEYCGSDELVAIYEVVGPLIIGKDASGLVCDGWPEYYDVSDESGLVAFCLGCKQTTMGQEVCDARVPDVIEIKMRLPTAEYRDMQAIASRRGVSLTEAIRGAIATEKLLRDAQAQGKRIILESKDEAIQEIVVFTR